jgi:predicted PurR-regulated permease PerM
VRKAAIDTEEPKRPQSSPTERRALGFFALVAAAALVWLSSPVFSGLFLGTLLAFSLLGPYRRLSARLGRPTLAAVLLATGSGLATVAGVLLLLYIIVARGIVAARELSHAFEPEHPFRRLISHIEEAIRTAGFGPIDILSRVRSAAADAASKLADLAVAVAGATFSSTLALFFTIMTTFFVLRHWPEILERAERMLPLHPMHTRVVLDEFQKVGKEVFIGTMLAGLAQGSLAGVGYAIARAPEVALLSALTAMSSLVPAIGTMLVWVPVGIGLILSGHAVAGIFVLLWGALVVVVLSDYVIRPRLVGRGGHVPTLLTFVSLFGGVKVFGLLGLVVGPVIAAVALALLRTYDREVCESST